MKNYLAILLFLVLAGCATSGKLNLISLGMKKDEVIKIMGVPASTSAKMGTEYLNYTLTDPIYGMPDPYYICIQGGIVTSYGKLGDFDSTKDPTQVIKVISDTKSDEKINIKTDHSLEIAEKLKTLNKLLSDRLINQDEFNEQKKKLLDSYTSK